MVGLIIKNLWPPMYPDWDRDTVLLSSVYHYRTGQLTIVTVGHRDLPFWISHGAGKLLHYVAATGVYIFNGQNLIWTNTPHQSVQIIP